MSIRLFNVYFSYYFGGLILLIHLIGTYCQQCSLRSLRVDPDHINVRLHGYAFNMFENVGANGCFDKCIRRKKMSFFQLQKKKIATAK